jgi:hypothetical protein
MNIDHAVRNSIYRKGRAAWGFAQLRILTGRAAWGFAQLRTPDTSYLIYHLHTPSPSFNANALGLLALEQELCFIAQHIPSPTAQNLDRVFSTGGNYPMRLHTLPTPKE